MVIVIISSKVRILPFQVRHREKFVICFPMFHALGDWSCQIYIFLRWHSMYMRMCRHAFVRHDRCSQSADIYSCALSGRSRRYQTIAPKLPLYDDIPIVISHRSFYMNFFASNISSKCVYAQLPPTFTWDRMVSLYKYGKTC